MNPGLWDLEEIYKRISCCKYDATYNNESNTSTTEKLTSHHFSNVQQYNQRMTLFDTTDLLFEQRYSVTAYLSNLSMGFLSGLFFEHIGDISAYQLNNFTRPWHT